MKIDGNGQAEPLSKQEFTKALNLFESNHHRLIFALCWYTTDRPSAVLSLSVKNVYSDPEKRRPRETIVIPRSTRKDRKTREVPCCRQLAAELRAYQPPESGWLFPGQAGGHLTYRAYYNALARVYAKMGLSGYSPYSTRRGALTHLLRQGMSTRRIQEISGHKSLASLQPYLESTAIERRQTVELL
ncbi:tyrosine-type recombinase/integrase [Nodosilinea sp. LEGE 07088]|uniref:tyrosine-type recombinase/integrase n=1 Tax=Nodosilinea sp. LEGE 07088 TaxID=2777968 RepID=UPI0018828594|nr:tyrosine-type recombinase/integrase [Nodosilinea sp. LEGE 07088]MBE9140433.1 tyrosine-type recombinase/integrase [Nodosilinea sp. LEGE 07088]